MGGGEVALNNLENVDDALAGTCGFCVCLWLGWLILLNTCSAAIVIAQQIQCLLDTTQAKCEVLFGLQIVCVLLSTDLVHLGLLFGEGSKARLELLGFLLA